ncbi:replication initiation negative regulator SeqA [Avibacterium paragallinarum]|uniref:Negative modulator of initiation of replication n=1 Tax=Avibacterium paragallinarum TaxID=728 RepID=A0A0F5F0N5_AVIPA|nr:replication initiation negative regulator SeqA [Avibacterium paragallinarum]KAA6209153.1 replication initiation negative regulator SeqA [Avibacterium paragallinarum]KKB01752.1 replication initiation regulator SeqA [Avibacterium paragallinarum]RZN59042.1 replication initiation negative regulator SeqA [Avibacterium paragallinarum]RZN59288.1 replication initiation negative regulator SeqA [Avibacterium paragallinarum]RZN71757.1 replication initiation negative regulator SeqA [Avibacterium paraga
MKIIEVDEELYQYIASQTKSIGESASDILRRLLNFSSLSSTPQSQSTAPHSEASSRSNQKTSAERGNASAVTHAESQSKVATKKQSNEAINKVSSKVRELIQSADFQQESKAVVRFLAILRILYRTNPESFAQATESLQGRTRIYFARDEGTLLMAGNHTKPKQIPDTPYWVITNTNSARKMLMLEGAMQSMHLPEALIDEVRTFFTVN